MKDALLWDLGRIAALAPHLGVWCLIACTPTADRYVTFAAWANSCSSLEIGPCDARPQAAGHHIITSPHHHITSHHITSHHITSHHHHTAEPLHQVIITSPHRPIAHTARALRHICLPTPISASTRIPPLFLSLCHLFDCRVVVVVVVVVDVCWVR